MKKLYSDKIRLEKLINKMNYL